MLAHGFFKAGLFLTAGSVKHEMDDEVDMRRFGELGAVMPATFAAFGCAYLGIIGIPPFLAFFTKDPIIEAAYARGGLSGVLLGTGAYRGRAHRVLHDPDAADDISPDAAARCRAGHPGQRRSPRACGRRDGAGLGDVRPPPGSGHTAPAAGFAVTAARRDLGRGTRSTSWC